MAQKYLFIAILCVKMSRVNKAWWRKKLPGPLETRSWCAETNQWSGPSCQASAQVSSRRRWRRCCGWARSWGPSRRGPLDDVERRPRSWRQRGWGLNMGRGTRRRRARSVETSRQSALSWAQGTMPLPKINFTNHICMLISRKLDLLAQLNTPEY